MSERERFHFPVTGDYGHLLVFFGEARTYYPLFIPAGRKAEKHFFKTRIGLGIVSYSPEAVFKRSILGNAYHEIGHGLSYSRSIIQPFCIDKPEIFNLINCLFNTAA